MILASFGNSPVSFVRMAEALEKYAHTTEEEIIVQSGYTEYDYKRCKAVRFMDKETFFHYLETCTVAILQGGWGSISEASDMGVRIVAFPRRNGIEHHHDQGQLVRALEDNGICLGCYNENDLPTLVEKAKTFDFKPIKRGSATTVINNFLENL